MNKIRTLLRAPLLTMSGYGVHSRIIFRSLFSDPLFDVHVESVKWGNTPFLTEDTDEKRAIKTCIQKYRLAQKQKEENWDLYITVTIPNEFEKKGKVNIGVTAAVETDRISHVWVQKCNEMDLIIVPSEHSKKVIETTLIDWENSNNGTKGTFKVEKPIIVCSEGVDIDVYKKLDKLYNNDIADIKFDCDFNFLHIGQWGKGGYGEDRKNIALLVKYFIETFRGRKDIGLVLKINMARNNVGDFKGVKERLEQIKANFKPGEVPPIHLLHGNLTHEEMANLYNHPQIKSFVSFSHGEGFCGLDYTKIITEDGLKRLDDVKVGDKVLTHEKRFMPVTQELSRQYNGSMYEIETYNGANKEKITLTGNHRIYVFNKDSSFNWVSAENIKNNDILCVPKPKYEQLNQIKKINILDFIKDENICEISDNIIGYKHSNKCFTPCKKYIDVNQNFAKIIGYYLAEGSYGNSTIHFSLHKNEKETIAKELIVALKDVFGLENHNIFINENKLDLTFNSKIVGLFLKSFCGSNAKEKYIHPYVFKFSRLAKLNLITSLVLGDGHIAEKNKNSAIEISLVNKSVLRSTRILLLEEGIISNFDFFNRKGIIKGRWNYDSNVERLRISQVPSFNKFLTCLNKNHDFVNVELHEERHITKGAPKAWIEEDWCFFEIKNINEIHYEGKVYNISVQEDQSYCTENFMVHNCLPLLEAAACELPIIATNWSGHLDFLPNKKFSAVDYDLKEIPDVAVWDPILIKGSLWAEVKADDAKHRLRKMQSSYSIPKGWAKEVGKHVRENFDLDTVCLTFSDTIKQCLLPKGGNATAERPTNPVEFLQSFIDTSEEYNILYTMPMSNGDVFISTAVIDGLMKEVHKIQPKAKLYFATSEQFASILDDNPNVHKVIPWQNFMMNVDATEAVFDLVLTPNVATQYTFSNWTRRGQGRLLAEEFANHCQTELGEYFIKEEDLNDSNFPNKYITFHPGSGKDKWEARNYTDWPEVLTNIRKQFPDVQIVQVGSADEPDFGDLVDVNLKGQTNVHQLAHVIRRSDMHLSIDTFTMHIAAAFDVPTLSLFGCSYAQSTGPWVKEKEKSKIILLESERRTCGCTKACYKDKPVAGNGYGNINEIDPKMVVRAAEALLISTYDKKTDDYERITAKISGYTTTYNIDGYPYVESIKSMLGFCDEVVIVDGCSTDGTWEKLVNLAEEDERIKLHQNFWDPEEPGMDGMQKAYARAFCDSNSEFLWQQDCDEVVHESDYQKIKLITKRFPLEADILHLPIAELWGNGQTVTGRRHSWKWRLSRNKPEITHGINDAARLTDEKTGKTYARQGGSDGCEYVNVMNNKMLPHTGFYLENRQIEMARVTNPEQYAKIMNSVFETLPSVYHYSWASLPRKIKNFTEKWDKLWSTLYQTLNTSRFPDIKTEEDIVNKSIDLFESGGEKEDEIKYKFALNRKGPAIMDTWLKNVDLNYE